MGLVPDPGSETSLDHTYRVGRLYFARGGRDAVQVPRSYAERVERDLDLNRRPNVKPGFSTLRHGRLLLPTERMTPRMRASGHTRIEHLLRS